MATIATDKLTRSAYPTARHKNMRSICKCLTPNSWAATNYNFNYLSKKKRALYVKLTVAQPI
jgi:predicted alpha/beta-hydrolase family hydrolase